MHDRISSCLETYKCYKDSNNILSLEINFSSLDVKKSLQALHAAITTNGNLKNFEDIMYTNCGLIDSITNRTVTEYDIVDQLELLLTYRNNENYMLCYNNKGYFISDISSFDILKGIDTFRLKKNSVFSNENFFKYVVGDRNDLFVFTNDSTFYYTGTYKNVFGPVIMPNGKYYTHYSCKIHSEYSNYNNVDFTKHFFIFIQPMDYDIKVLFIPEKNEIYTDYGYFEDSLLVKNLIKRNLNLRNYTTT